MDEKALYRQFFKYGGMVITFNLTLTFIILSIAYPMFSDRRLLVFFLIAMILCFVLINLYYYMMLRKVIIPLRDMSKNFAIIHTQFKLAAQRTFIASILTIILLYFPAVPCMYFLFGYTNLYFHAFVFFINIFVFLYLGYNSQGVWYTRTYPLGRFGIPIAIQGLGSKIISLVFPTILLASVFISSMLYFVGQITIREGINARVRDNLKTTIQISELRGSLENIELPPVFSEYKGTPFFHRFTGFASRSASAISCGNIPIAHYPQGKSSRLSL